MKPSKKYWPIYRDHYNKMKELHQRMYGEELDTKDILKEAMDKLTTIGDDDVFLTYDEGDSIEFWMMGIRKELRNTFKGTRKLYKLIKQVEGLKKPMYDRILTIEAGLYKMLKKAGFEDNGMSDRYIYLKKEALV